MIQTNVEYDKEQLERLKKASADAKKELKDAKPGYKQAAVFLDSWVQQNFRSEGEKVGGWEPFKSGGRVTTKGGATVIDTSAKLLQKTGALRISFKPFATKNNAGIGSDLDYSEPQNEKRRMLPEDNEVKNDINDILEKYIKSNVMQNFKDAFKSVKGAL